MSKNPLQFFVFEQDLDDGILVSFDNKEEALKYIAKGKIINSTMNHVLIEGVELDI